MGEQVQLCEEYQKQTYTQFLLKTHQEPCPEEASNDKLHFSDGLCSHTMLCWRVSLILGGFTKHQATARIGLGSLLSPRGSPCCQCSHLAGRRVVCIYSSEAPWWWWLERPVLSYPVTSTLGYISLVQVPAVLGKEWGSTQVTRKPAGH